MAATKLKNFKTIFILMFFIAFIAKAGVSKLSVTLDSLFGKAEVQRTGQFGWTILNVGDNLYNSDILRVLDNSFARCLWPDGNTTFIHANSQIQVNLFESSESMIISSHVTILFGAVFFLVKEVLPKPITKVFDTKVYTPTAVVSIRGTSFSIGVDGTNGASDIKVLNGTVLVRNVLKNSSTFISAGFQTKVEIRTDPVVAKAVLDSDIVTLKTWVPPPVIEKEINEQYAKANRDHQILASNFQDKFIIIPFDNVSQYKGKWNLGASFAKQLADLLIQSNKLCTIDQSPPGTDPFRIGQAAKTRFVIIGEVQSFDIAQHAEISTTADDYKEYYIAHVSVRVQIIDITEKKLVLDNVFVGESRGKNSKENSWQRISSLELSLNDAKFRQSILGSAFGQVMDQSLDKILQYVNYQ
jgi:hypothetical protein